MPKSLPSSRAPSSRTTPFKGRATWKNITPRTSTSPYPAASKEAFTYKPFTKVTDSQLAHLLELYRINPLPDYDERLRFGNEHGMAEKAVKIWFQNRRQKEKNRAALNDTTNYSPSHSSPSDSSGSPPSLPHTPGSMETDSGSDDDNETDDGVYTPTKRDSVPRVTVVGTDDSTVLEAAMILCFMKSSV
ncbi:hypothetical protein BOTBODRAFT_32664 [Botryobasidium botryosum FD-172 SS1]|uniref:Homeobox domain-containing protein n=1 Tax=Botryobasidium botryosum (strain FD-172 SS1) TaxID=930990 RepID=A0A067MFG0_BOTB1|nr:hypothetical protein BOTBODRAFT_32664 [Botryobasidium botryosum FD-172 SS1]